jgi:hypothetical protein
MLLYKYGSHFGNNRDYAIELGLYKVFILTVAALCTIYINAINFVKYVILYFAIKLYINAEDKNLRLKYIKL